jgi:integrase/recombinase XerD
MLTIYRRHLKSCSHRAEGRKYRRCRCPIWADGFLGANEIRESLELRDWEKAQQRIREWEAEGIHVVPDANDAITVMSACETFEHDAKARGLENSTMKKYTALFKQLKTYSSERGIRFLEQLNLDELRLFRQSWRDNGISALKKLERLRAFLRFAQESGWIKENPAKKLASPKVTSAPTMPFTRQQIIEMLAACEQYPDNYGVGGQANAVRLRCLVLFLRFSGMRIGDAATCPVDRLKGDRVFLYTQKTNVPVNVKLPPFVVEALNAMPRVSERYFFWTGQGTPDTVAGNWRRSLRKLFKLAGIKSGHPHRFRDTFAIELLLAGTPLDRVAVLLGHSSVKVTERHYSPWIRDRQEQLEADLERSWLTDPLVLAQTKGTPEVHKKQEVVN